MYDTITCAECGDETDASKYATCSCGGCKKNFCSVFKKDCYGVYHQKCHECKGGRVREITNPQWICNLVKTLQKDSHAI